MIALSTTRSTSALAGVVVALAIGGCATRQVATRQGPAGRGWVSAGGGGAFNDGGRRSFYGWSYALGMRDEASRRWWADSIARQNVAASLEAYITSLIRDYSRSIGNLAVSDEQQLLEATRRTLLSRATIIDRWDTLGGVHSLANLDLEQVADAIERMDQLNARTREYIRQNAQPAFDRLQQLPTKPGRGRIPAAAKTPF